jgi:hypothetical protein
MPIKKISADEARAKRKDHVRDTPNGSAVLKAVKSGGSYDPEKRVGRFIMSSQSRDRYGDVVRTAGIEVERFEDNPVGLLFHNSRSWPVGSWSNLEKVLKSRPPRLEGDLTLLAAGGPREIDDTAWMLEHGGIRACSIGFIPDWDAVEVEYGDDGQFMGLIFNKSELLECSVCAIPANPDALLKAADGDMQLAKEIIEDILDNFERTPAGVLISKADFSARFEKVINEKAANTVVIENKSGKDVNVTVTELPITDDQQAEAHNRAVAFELAKVCPPLEGMKIVVESDNGIFKFFEVKNGKIEHTATGAGVVPADRTVNMVASEKTVDGKFVVEITKHYSQALTKGAAGWEPKQDSRAEETNQPEAPTTNAIVLEIDTKEAEAGLGRLLTLATTVSEKMSALFKRQAPAERVEPTLDTPVLPGAEAIEASKARAAALRDRHASKGLI